MGKTVFCGDVDILKNAILSKLRFGCCVCLANCTDEFVRRTVLRVRLLNLATVCRNMKRANKVNSNLLCSPPPPLSIKMVILDEF
jgi:hypothetical protein